MSLVLIVIVFLLLLLFPFILGMIELYNPKDSTPLYINMNYTKDPRYFGKSFKSILRKAIGTGELEPGVRNVQLSKSEKIEVTANRRIHAGEEGQHVYYVTGNFTSTRKAQFTKEIYVTGDVALGFENTVRAVACEGKIFIADNVDVIRWIDAEKEVEICRGCNLGISASSGGVLKVSRHCRFKRLYGLPVTTVQDIPVIAYPMSGQYSEEAAYDGHDESRALEEISDSAWIVHENYSVIPPAARVEQDFITRKDLKIRENCVVNGNIRSYGNLTIGENVRVSDNVFAEHDVDIGAGSVIAGNIFTQGCVQLKQGVTVGDPETVKSVIGKKGVTLGQDVRVYGYVMTEGEGIIG